MTHKCLVYASVGSSSNVSIPFLSNNISTAFIIAVSLYLFLLNFSVQHSPGPIWEDNATCHRYIGCKQAVQNNVSRKLAGLKSVDGPKIQCQCKYAHSAAMCMTEKINLIHPQDSFLPLLLDVSGEQFSLENM